MPPLSEALVGQGAPLSLARRPLGPNRTRRQPPPLPAQLARGGRLPHRSVAVASRKTTFVSLLSHLSRSTKERAQPEHILITVPNSAITSVLLYSIGMCLGARLDVSWSCPGPNDSLRPISSCDDLN